MKTHPVADTITREYLARTRGSQVQHEMAIQVLPGGDTRRSVYFFPYPTYMERGKGCILYDVDGNRYLDFHNNYTSLIHGHAHPPTIQAVQAQLPAGTLYGSPAARQHELAAILCERIPSVERVRFCNSGTEATMLAMRVARAVTGRDVILKMDGGYHGSHDFAEVNITPTGAVQEPPGLRKESRGVPDCVLDAVMVVPFNDLDAVEETLTAHNHRIAAIFLEPMLNAGGLVPPLPGYLIGLRRLADKYGVLLAFDEVVTFRQSLGGWQEMDGVQPDITALGKIIGGGFPVGAVGGRAEVMEHFSPTRPDNLSHSGTFNGNSVTMVAGIATLRHYGQSEIDRINRLGERLRKGILAAFSERGLKASVSGQGSLAYIHWTDQEIITAADSARAAADAGQLLKLLHLGLLNHGIWLPYRGELALSTAMTASEIDQACEAVRDTLDLLMPYVEDMVPQLLQTR